MSGNFVQRGEPAIIDKWLRTQMALNQGADIVVELPFLVSVQGADHFAQGAVSILERLGIDNLTFGSELACDYNALKEGYAQKQSQINSYLSDLDNSLSYPQKMTKVWQAFFGLSFSSENPNHILGLSYTKACSDKGIQLSPIKRLGSGFHSRQKAPSFPSATAIREHRTDTAFIQAAMPSSHLFLKAHQVKWQHYWLLLKYQIITHPNLCQILGINEEVANRLYQAIRQANDIASLVQEVSTKRYTKSYIRRLLTFILVGVDKREIPKAIHILGFSKAGQQHLASLKKQVSLVSRIGSTPWDRITQRADAIYQLGHPKIAEQTWGRYPIQGQSAEKGR